MSPSYQFHFFINFFFSFSFSFSFSFLPTHPDLQCHACAFLRALCASAPPRCPLFPAARAAEGIVADFANKLEQVALLLKDDAALRQRMSQLGEVKETLWERIERKLFYSRELSLALTAFADVVPAALCIRSMFIGKEN